MNNLVELVKLVSTGDRYTFSQLLVNPDSVSTLEESYVTQNLLREKQEMFPAGLDTNVRFSTLIVDGKSYTVVGDPSSINQKLRKNSRQLLRG